MALDSGFSFDMYAIFSWRPEDLTSNQVDHDFVITNQTPNPAPLARSTAAEKAATNSRRLDGLVTTDVNQPILFFSLALSNIIEYLRRVMPLHEDLGRLKFLTPTD